MVLSTMFMDDIDSVFIVSVLLATEPIPASLTATRVHPVARGHQKHIT